MSAEAAETQAVEGATNGGGEEQTVVRNNVTEEGGNTDSDKGNSFQQAITAWRSTSKGFTNERGEITLTKRRS